MIFGLGTLEVVALVVSLVGLLPVLTQYRDETKLFTIGYCLLVVGMLATNLETFVLGEVLNLVEHGIGIGLAGVVFLYAAYQRRKTVLQEKGVA